MGEGEVLSQGEVDALLRGVGDGEVETETDQGPEDETGVVPRGRKNLRKWSTGDHAHRLTAEPTVLNAADRRGIRRLPSGSAERTYFGRLVRSPKSSSLG